MEELTNELLRPSEKYIFLSKLQINLDNATRICEKVEEENILHQEKKERNDESGGERKIYKEEECPICYENFSGLTKVVPACGHEICLSCYKHLRNDKCVKCRLTL